MGASAHPGGQLGVGLSKEGCSGQTLVFQRRPPRGGREGACARGCWKVRKVRTRWSRMERGWPGWGWSRPSYWAPAGWSGGGSQRTRRGPGSAERAAPCCCRGSSGCLAPLLLPWRRRRCQLANESPSAANNNTTLVNRAEPEGSLGGGGRAGTRYRAWDQAAHPSSLAPTLLPGSPASPPCPSSSLLSHLWSGQLSTSLQSFKD